MKKEVSAALLHKGFDYIHKDPEKHLLSLARWGERLTANPTHRKQIAAFRRAAEDPDSGGYRLLMRMIRELDPRFLDVILSNFVINSTWLGNHVVRELRKKHDMNVPWAILMDPTTACNLHCIGCWAADYRKSDTLSFETMDRIVREGKDLGIYVYLFSGGEPLVRKHDLILLAREHDDAVFAAFTNATLIDAVFTDALLQAGNFVPIISIEGDREHNDARRGEGVYDACIHAMGLLHSRGIPFGFSTCYHRYNTEFVGSDQFIDQMIEQGALFGWFFTYIPTGTHAATELIATAQQREYMFHRVREIRNTKALFVIDFWNDGEYVGGCIAGGRNYLHINARGDMEPCAFIHFACENIHGKSLFTALGNPLFKAYHDNQPFDENLHRPCPMFDIPERLVQMVHDSGAVSTELFEAESVEQLCDKCTPAAEAWAPVAQRLWETCRAHPREDRE
ncbi:MAG: radical SAM protein [Spirochaetia bacterium]|nr:radical SAM protein [Spirochaetia bacterium]MCF7941622.1 radical SAM protein [Spirochaetia bacterium]